MANRTRTRIHEQSLNEALGEVIESLAQVWAEPEGPPKVDAERVGLVEGGRRADVLVHDLRRTPIAIETSFDPRDAERDALAKLGLTVREQGDRIETTLAIHWPQGWEGVASAKAARKRLEQEEEFWCALYREKETNPFRFPEEGWITTNARELASDLWAVGLSEERIEKLSEEVAKRLTEAADRLTGRGSRSGSLPQRIATKMDQQGVLQGLRTAAVMWLNAMMMHEAIDRARTDIGLMSPGDTMNADGTPDPQKTVNAWKQVLTVNWEAVFVPALEALEMASQNAYHETTRALEKVLEAKQAIDGAKVGSTLNVGAELLPRLSENRRETAAYYTRPVIAELVAGLGVGRGLEPSDRLADTACGTGTILRAVYRRLRELGQSMAVVGGTPEEKREEFHRKMMESVIRGLDISRMAAHLTASSLTAMVPGVDYRNCQIGTAPVGRPNRTGSLELLQGATVGDLLEQGTTTTGTNGHERSVTVQDGSLAFYPGNPPYSRARGGMSGWNIAGLSEEEKEKVTKQMKVLIRGTAANADAGMASMFLAMGLRKLYSKGVLALVLPSTATGALSWRKIRQELEAKCVKILTVTVAKGARNEDSMSADTGLNEMLLIAEKGSKGKLEDPVHVTLDGTPRDIWEARVLARAVRRSIDVRQGQREGVIRIGTKDVGRWAREARSNGLPWASAGADNADLAFAAAELREGRVRLADGSGYVELGCPMGTIGGYLNAGPSHDLLGHLEGRDPRGAFEFRPIQMGEARDVALWETDAKKQKTMECSPTHAGHDPGDGRSADQARVRGKRGRIFFQRGLQYTSQALAVGWTPELCHGGSAWVSGRHENPDVEKAAVLWGNSTPGLMLYWANAQRQQRGRGRMQVGQTKQHHFPQLDRLAPEKLREAGEAFNRLKGEELQPVKDAENDDVREKIDEAVARLMCKDAEDETKLKETFRARRKQLGLEPQVRGPEAR